MKKRLKVFCLTLFVISFFNPLFSAESFTVTIIHTNDLHGMMQPFTYKSNKNYNGENKGGLARRASVIKKIQAEAGKSVLIDTGDFFTRGPWHQKFMGMPEIESFNLLHYDMAIVGNNEFKGRSKNVQEIFTKLLHASSFPWLCANLTVGDTHLTVEGVHPYVIRNISGVKVGFVGLTKDARKELNEPLGWTFEDPMTAAKRIVPIARKECDILIAVTHIGDNDDVKLAQSIEGIDAIIGGHSHRFIEKPLMMKNPAGIEVPIVQAGEQGIVVGKLVLTFEKDSGWHLKKADGSLIPVNEQVTPDADMQKLVDSYLNQK